MIDIGNRLAEIQGEIQALSAKNETQSLPAQVVAVSKKQPLELMRQLIAANHTSFGENYLQDALPKIQALTQYNLDWHFIGAVQSNKTRDIAQHFNWVHAVDRFKIAQRLSDQRTSDNDRLNICLQVNIDDDPSKAGLLPERCLSLAEAVKALPNLRLRGLMTILKAGQSDLEIRRSYAKTKVLFETIKAQVSLEDFDTLSMGMSNDWKIAVEEGATLVRIGTAIFGARSS